CAKHTVGTSSLDVW
nr:immunoglobulin heavy chain junction region [Macaca mulatta]